MSNSRKDWFPTPIWHFILNDYQQLNDTRSAAKMLVPPMTEFSPWTLPKISYQPQAGTMLLFPSWLLHGVEMNMSRELRISLSFNIGMSALSPIGH